METIALRESNFASPIYKSNFTSPILQVLFYKSYFTSPILQVQFYKLCSLNSTREQMTALVSSFYSFWRGAGLQDGLFSNQKSQFGYILLGLGMWNVGKFYDQLDYFTALWYILWPFGIICVRLVYLVFRFWYVWTKKNLATLVWRWLAVADNASDIDPTTAAGV
jgi:hypothetical protein